VRTAASRFASGSDEPSAQRKAVEPVFNVQLQFFQALDADRIRQAAGLFGPQRGIQPLVFRQKTKYS
jgi:hypothetical protein